MKNDTIVALATPSMPSAICLVRMSGPDSFEIAQKVFHNKTGKQNAGFKHFKIYYGYLGNNDDIVDEVLLHSMKAPHTYTGEDSIEITAHGSVLIQKKIIELLIASGARMAEPGEFTKRAFIKAKLILLGLRLLMML
jgi:tRNA modification GTPase